MRKILSQQNLSPSATQAIEQFHPSYVTEVEKAIQSNKFVLVGMGQNPVVKKARRILAEKNISYSYIEHGNYFSKWKQRLAIKLWSGWPTFPMVFIDGKLIGGCKEMIQWFEAQKN